MILKNSEKLKILEDKFKALEAENLKLKDDKSMLLEKQNKLEVENASLYEQSKTVKNNNNSEINTIKILSKIFTQGQIKVLLNPKKQCRWSSEDIASAIYLRSVSAKAYRYLRNKLKYPLPALSTLRRCVAAFDCSPGILDQVILDMKNNAKKLTDLEKLTVLSFDEMSLSKKICFKRKEENLFGPHSQAQGAVLRGLASRWKQPIYYDYDSPMTKETLFKIICSVEEAGYKVISVACDFRWRKSSSDVEKALDISPEKTSFLNPYDTTRQIFVFGDAPHLLKLAMNHFVDKGFVTDNNVTLTCDCFKEILNMQNTDLKIAYKIRKDHVFVKNKQNVKLAAQLFSNSTAKAVKFFGQGGDLSGPWSENSKMIQLFNDWFDVLNPDYPSVS